MPVNHTHSESLCYVYPICYHNLQLSWSCSDWLDFRIWQTLPVIKHQATLCHAWNHGWNYFWKLFLYYRSGIWFVSHKYLLYLPEYWRLTLFFVFCSECLQVTVTKTVWKQFLFSGTWKSQVEKNQARLLVQLQYHYLFIFTSCSSWSFLLDVAFSIRKVHFFCQNFVFSNECAARNVQTLNAE
jgi:hypothetical protein